MKKNNWVILITLSAFFISIIFSVISNIILKDINVFLGSLLIIFFIVLGVLFDMVGIAVASSDEKSFHSMASRKIHGSKISLRLINYSDRVSSFCNDVIGDICNIISGSAGIIIATRISDKFDFNLTIIILIMTGLIASLTIGGKAYGKFIAINNSEKIVLLFAKLIKRH